MGRIKVLFWFDVEDFINPESETALLALLNMLDERGITGIFKIVGEKIRKLEQHGRADILERLQRHEVGYHTDFHSVHPVVTEYLEPLGFREGADEFERREGAGFADLRRITGMPVRCYGQPGDAWAPQAFPVLNRWGVRSYLDVHDQVTLGGKPFWYGGLLNLTSLAGTMNLPFREGALEQAKCEFERLCEAQREDDIGLISICYHPTEFVFDRFWDAVNFAKGRNPAPSEWVKPPFRPAGDMERFLQMVAEFVDYTLSKDNVAYIGTAELLALETSYFRTAGEAEVIRLAERTGRDLRYLAFDGMSWSASDLFSLFRRYMLGEPLDREPETIYGPERAAESDPAGAVRVADVMAALRRDLPDVCGFRQLPDYFPVGGRRVNPVDLTCTMAAIIRGRLGPDDSVELVHGRLASADHTAQGEWARKWSIFADDFAVPNIVEHSRLQCWTLKPALF